MMRAMRDRMLRWAMGSGLGLCLMATAETTGASVPNDVQALYDKKEYQKTVDEIGKLEKEASAVPDVRRLKVRALLRLGKPKDALEEYDKLESALKQDDTPLLREVALGFIVVMMKDMREQMRGAAYTALKEFDSDEAVPFFEDGLTDGSGPVRMLAVEGLGRSEAGRRSKKLRSAINDQAGLVKARVVKVLGKSGDPSVTPLIENAAKDELQNVRIAAYGALIRLGRKESWEQLRKAAEAANPEDRSEALRTIAELKDQRAIPLMMEQISYKQPSVRASAARGLGHLGQKDSRPSIEKLLKDPVPAVRESAAVALADLGAKESVQVLSQGLNDPVPTVRAATVAALLQLDQPYEAVASIVRGLAQQSDPAARASAAFSLGKATKANRQGAIAMLETLTLDPLPGPKIVAIRSLGHIGGLDLLPLFKASLHDENDAVRSTAAGAMLHLWTSKS